MDSMFYLLALFGSMIAESGNGPFGFGIGVGIGIGNGNGDNTADDPYSPLNAVNWQTMDLAAEIQGKFKVADNGYNAGNGVQGIDLNGVGLGFEVRTMDATGNNLENPGFGATHAQALRCVPSEYADGVSAPNGESRMNPREISNVVAKQTPEEDPKFVNNRGLTQFAWQWGQFIDHDVTLISEATAAEVGVLSTEHIDVYIPCNDPFFDADQTSEDWCDAKREIEILRTHSFPGSGTNEQNPRQSQNEITSFVDASMIYGSDQTRADNLRKFEDGKLRLDGDDIFGFLPHNNLDGEVEENEPNNEEAFGVAGDVRPNEQLGLLTMHTIWVRFHNIMAEEVAESESLTELSPAEFDEAVFQYTRLIVTAIVQKITYQDWLPALFGQTAMDRFVGVYEGYNSSLDGGACLIFSSAAFRLGHTLLPQFLPLRNADCSVWDDFDPALCDACNTDLGGIELRSAFFVPDIAEIDGFIEALLNGFSCTLANEIDVSVTGEVRNFLFESAVSPLGSEDRIFGDLDLITLNLQRGREHGLPDFNSVRGMIGQDKLTDFTQLTSDQELVEIFREVYHDDIDDMDLFLALLAEDHFDDGSFGETISNIVLSQFKRFRDGDRFWYQNYIKPGELLDFVNSMTLKSVVELTTAIDNIDSLDSIRHNVFQNSRAISIFDDVNNFDPNTYFAHSEQANVIDESSNSVPHSEHHQDGRHSAPHHKHFRPVQRPQSHHEYKAVHHTQPQQPQQPQQPLAPQPNAYQPGFNNYFKQEPVHSGPYIIQLSNMQIMLIFAGIISVIFAGIICLQQCRRNDKDRYRPVKYDTESDLDASDREKLQS